MLKNMLHKVTRFLRSDDGPTAVEYLFLMSMIIVVLLMAINAVGVSTSRSLETSSDEISDALGN